MSRPLGLMFRLPHGLSNSVLLPTVTRFSWPGAEQRYAEIARAIELASAKSPDRLACESLTAWLDELNHDLQVPRLRECCGGDVERFRGLLTKMATDALDSGSPQNNPVVPAASQIVELFEQAW
jgi:alcohol dehydrogenase class IV